MTNGKLFFALAAQKLGTDKALPYLALDPTLGAGARTVMSIKMIEEAETQASAITTAETRATTAEATLAAQSTELADAAAARDAASEEAATAKAALETLRVEQDTLTQEMATLRSDLHAKDTSIAELTAALVAEKETVAKADEMAIELRKQAADATEQASAITRERDAARAAHASLQEQAETQDRAFTALAEQFAGPDATADQKAAAKERLMTSLASVRDEGPEALRDLMLGLMTDRHPEHPFAALQAKLDAHPAVKKKVETKIRALEKEHFDRLKALHDDIQAELDAADAPKTPRAPRKKKG